MILRPGPRESCLERFPLKGFLLFLMLSSTGIFVTSVWKLHVVTKTGSYPIAQVAEISAEVHNGNSADGGMAAFKTELLDMIRVENKNMLQEILERIQYLSNGKAGNLLSEDGVGGGQPVAHENYPSNNLWSFVVKAHQNLTVAYWSRNWQNTLAELDDSAKKYLQDFENKCEAHDSKENIYLRRGAGKVDDGMPLCPCVPGTLVGRQIPNTKLLLNLTWEATEPLSERVMIGGYWKPRDCIPRRRVAVVIPCRDREPQLRAFLVHMHPLLQRQLVEYRIFVVEQEWPQIYNKASSMNIGFLEASKMLDFDCVMFHDVDLLAEDDRSVVYCGDRPLHYGAYLDKWNYNIGYSRIFGGAVVLTKEQFLKTNGYSNQYFGWGGEDDDFEKRVRNVGFEIERPPKEVSKHSSLTHKRDKANPVNPDSSRGWQNLPAEYVKDGLNTARYEHTDIILEPLFTWIKVDITLMENNSILTQKAFQYFKVYGSCRQEENRTLPILNELSISVISCRFECDMEPGCISFIYYRSRDAHCVLLSALCQIDRHVTDAIVYIKAANASDTNYSMRPGDCKGNDIDGLTVTLRECIQACNSRKDCAGFAYGELLHNPCWLKNDTCSVTQENVLGVKFYTKVRRELT